MKRLAKIKWDSLFKVVAWYGVYWVLERSYNKAKSVLRYYVKSQIWSRLRSGGVVRNDADHVDDIFNIDVSSMMSRFMDLGVVSSINNSFLFISFLLIFPYLSVYFFRLFNTIFTTSIFPFHWTMAWIVPIPKVKG